MSDEAQVDYYNMKIEDMSVRHREHLDKLLDEYNSDFVDLNRKLGSEANATERSLSGQLMLVTTVITTISVVALGNSDLMKQLVDIHRYLILSIFLLQIVSIASGIINYLKIEEFFTKSANEYASASKLINERQFDSIAGYFKKVGKILKNRKDHSSKAALNVQIISIALSLAIYGVLISLILF